MSQTLKYNNLAVGMWKFDDSLPPETLVKLAEEWRDGPEGYRYEALYVRKCSRNQFAIGFSYRLPEGEADHAMYFLRTSDTLKRRFGNQLAGWDITSQNIWIIVE